MKRVIVAVLAIFIIFSLGSCHRAEQPQRGKFSRGMEESIDEPTWEEFLTEFN